MAKPVRTGLSDSHSGRRLPRCLGNRLLGRFRRSATLPTVRQADFTFCDVTVTICRQMRTLSTRRCYGASCKCKICSLMRLDAFSYGPVAGGEGGDFACMELPGQSHMRAELASGGNGGTLNAPSAGSLRLVLCDDYQILAQALAAVLQARGHQVLSVTTDPAAGVAAVAACDPDICILDADFPGQGSGLKAARLIRRHHPRTKVLILSSVADAHTLAEAVKIGVAGLIPKDHGVDDIAEALQVIATGGAVFGRGLPHKVLSPGMTKPQSDDPLDALAPREKEVLARIVEGQSTKQMARAMSISNGTVRMYVRNVLTALGAHSRLEVAAIARRGGMLNRLQAGGANLTQAG